ncbi:MAG TPA: redoxin family protein [Candidatus Paceibacterota bacterium]
MRKAILVIVIAVVIGSIYYFESKRPMRIVLTGDGKASEEIPLPAAPSAVASTSTNSKSLKIVSPGKANFPRAKEIAKPFGFINTPPIKLSDLVGKKIILIDFWTYSCINCVRTIPYLNAWYEKYKDKGFVILGVHTPEFEFEKDYNNVSEAVKKFGIQYPVVLDNDYGTWNAYGNLYWPREYLIDIEGYIVHDHIGEGGYVATEGAIQEALEERMRVLNESGEVAKDTAKPIGAGSVEFDKVKSPEIYFGSARNSLLGNGAPNASGEQTFEAPAEVKKNTLYLSGRWSFSGEYAESRTREAKIVFRYEAKNVYLVGSSENGVNLKVLRDGKEVKSIEVKNEELYRLIDGTDYGEHTLEVIIQNPGLRVFTLTFG